MNRFLGEAKLDTESGPLTVKLDIDAMIAAEELSGSDLQTMLKVVGGQIKLSVLRALLWAGLRHLPQPPSPAGASEIIAEVGVAQARAAVVAALTGALPTPGKAKEQQGRPPKAAGGSGSGSTGDGAPSAETRMPSGG